MAAIIEAFKERLAKRRAEKPERLRRQADAKAHRLEMKRSHETNPKGGGQAAAGHQRGVLANRHRTANR